VQDSISSLWGTLHGLSVFCDKSFFDDQTNGALVYCSMILLGVLLYGAESWVIKEPTIRKMETFHNRCMCCILDISQAEQRIRYMYLTTAQIRTMYGMETSMKDLLSVRHLHWLGHTSRISGDRISKKLCLDGCHRLGLHMEPSLGGETK